MSKKRAIGRIGDDINLDDDELTILGPITKKSYSISEIMLDGAELVIKKSKFNQRKLEYLSMSSMNDIYPDIVRLKRNTTPILAVGSKSDFRIISGLRRAFCVANSSDAKAVIHLLSDIDPADEEALAISSDLHQKPTALDKALSLNERDDFEQLMAMPVRELGKILGVSKSQAAILKNAVSVPEQIYTLFPNIKFIEITLIGQIAKFGLDTLVEASKQVKPFSEHLSDEQLAEHEIAALPDEIYIEAYKKVKADLLLTLKAISELPRNIKDCIEDTNLLSDKSLDLLIKSENESALEACELAKERALSDENISDKAKSELFLKSLQELLVEENHAWKHFEDVANQHVKTKVSKNGELVLTISNALNDSNREQLAELLASFKQ